MLNESNGTTTGHEYERRHRREQASATLKGNAQEQQSAGHDAPLSAAGMLEVPSTDLDRGVPGLYLHKALSEGQLTRPSEQPLRQSALVQMQQIYGNRSSRNLVHSRSTRSRQPLQHSHVQAANYNQPRPVPMQRAASSGSCGCADEQQKNRDTTDMADIADTIDAMSETDLPQQVGLPGLPWLSDQLGLSGQSVQRERAQERVEEGLPVQRVAVQRNWWDDVTTAAGEIGGGISVAAQDVWGGVTSGASDVYRGATGAASSLGRGDVLGAMDSYNRGMYNAATNVGGGLLGAATDYAGGVLGAADTLISGASPAARWTCDASCNVEGTAPHCTGRVTGSGSGPSEADACREAKRDATGKAPRGCYGRHCRCLNCSK